MKNRLLFISIVPLLFSLTACDDGAWKEKWGTPELFLENVIEMANVYMYENEGDYFDNNFEIRDLIKESGPFESIDKKEPKVERYFTYQGYWQPATSGPNYCNMSIWDDGLIKIHHKSSLGPHGYLYFSMDALKASNLNDIVFEKILANQESNNSSELLNN